MSATFAGRMPQAMPRTSTSTPQHGLKSITRGSAPEAELLEALGLDPGRYFLALAQTVGK